MEKLISGSVDFRKINTNKIIFVTLLLSAFIGVSILVFPSTFSPAILLAGLIGILVFLFWLSKPIYALVFALFIIFLPIGIIPAEIQSLLNRGFTIAATCLWLVDVISNKKHIKLKTTTILMILFIVWSSITLAWASDFNEGITVLQTYVLRLILFLILIINQINSKKDLDILMNTLAIVGVLLVTISLGIILFQGYTPGSRLKVFNVNENSFGLILLFTTPAVLWPYMSQVNNSRRNLLAGLYILLSIGLIGLSGSRGSALSYAVMLLFFLFWKSTRKWGIFGVLIIILSLITVPFIFSTTIARFLGSPGETILGGREIIWPAGWQLIKENFLFGIGIGNSPFEITQYLIHLGAKWISQYSNPFHNPILVIWAETGLPGLLLYLGVLFSSLISFLYHYYKSIKNSKQFLLPYFALISSMIFGYLISWIKGGGMESDFSYFLVIALLLIPSCIYSDPKWETINQYE